MRGSDSLLVAVFDAWFCVRKGAFVSSQSSAEGGMQDVMSRIPPSSLQRPPRWSARHADHAARRQAISGLITT